MLSLSSPAKINLFLRILGRRNDGYHELASLFQTIDLCDTLHFCLADEDHIVCTDPSLPVDGTNLVSKAANLFRKKTGIQSGLRVDLEKRIPQQAGLGGGSSNAATTLYAFNRLCGEPIKEALLAEWSAEIGSDIPFFFSGGTAYCTGRGERLQFIKSLQPTSVCIVKPSHGLSTPQVYGKLNLGDLPPRDPKAILDQFLQGHPLYFNDLEAPAFSILPELKELKFELLKNGFSTVLMSGSGSSFFCLGDGQLPNRAGLEYHSAAFINRNPGEWFSQVN